MNVGSLFTGIGGFDLGFERAGFNIAWQCEIDRKLSPVLEQRFPQADRFGDIREAAPILPPVHVLVGGDPCPKHSRARAGRASAHPDLSGWFLCVAGRLRPRWLVRENVLAPTVKHFDAALVALGYRTCIVGLDAASFTGQSRPRDFVVGCADADPGPFGRFLDECESGRRDSETCSESGEIMPCLLSRKRCWNFNTPMVFEAERNHMRTLDSAEYERFAGFPADWAEAISEQLRYGAYGRSVVPECVQWIADRIARADHGKTT